MSLIHSGRLNGGIVVRRWRDKYIITMCPSISLDGVPKKEKYEDDEDTFDETKKKLDASLVRSRSVIKQLAYCNDWDWFCTLTFRAERYELETTVKTFSAWLKMRNNNRNTNIKYLIIPEGHKDGAIHCHGLLRGLPSHEVRQFNRKDYPRIKEELITLGYFDWLPYADKFGHVSLGQIKSRDAVSQYITKYITKDMAMAVTEQHAHTYYASKGLERAEKIGMYHKNKADITPMPWDYVSDRRDRPWHKTVNSKEEVISFLAEGDPDAEGPLGIGDWINLNALEGLKAYATGVNNEIFFMPTGITANEYLRKQRLKYYRKNDMLTEIARELGKIEPWEDLGEWEIE